MKLQTSNRPFTPYQLDQLRSMLEPLVLEMVSQIVSTSNDTPLAKYLCGVKQVSEYFGMPEGTIRKHLKDIKHSKRGKRIYFTVEDVIAWIERGNKTRQAEDLETK